MKRIFLATLLFISAAGTVSWACYMEVPFGFAAIDLLVKSGDALVVELQMTLTDFWTGAKSALPNQD